MSNLNTHYVSGEQGTTGREPFEEPTRSLTGNQGAGVGVGQGVGHEHHHHGHHGHHHGQGQSGLGSAGLRDEGSGGIPHSQAPATSGQHIGNATGPAVGTAGTGTGAGFTSASGHEHSELSGRSGVTSGYGTGEGKGNESTTVGLATGTGAAQPVGGERTHAEVPGPGSTKPSGEGYGGVGASETGSHVDRVGPQGQGQAAYERTGAGGPVTGGAAGTDRFDTGSTGATHGSAEGQDTSQRAPGKGTGGIGGVLGTSDKDFTGRERTGGALGAYADSEGPFEGNTSGPKGHTALTGREGNLDNNPVAQAKSRGDGTGSTASTHDSTTGEKEHKGFIEKVKDAITK